MSAGKRTETNCDAADSNSDKKKKKSNVPGVPAQICSHFCSNTFLDKTKIKQTNPGNANVLFNCLLMHVVLQHSLL